MPVARVVGICVVLGMRMDVSLDLNNEQETVSNFVKVFRKKKSRIRNFLSKSALKSLENEKTPVQILF